MRRPGSYAQVTHESPFRTIRQVWETDESWFHEEGFRIFVDGKGPIAGMIEWFGAPHGPIYTVTVLQNGEIIWHATFSNKNAYKARRLAREAAKKQFERLREAHLRSREGTYR